MGKRLGRAALTRWTRQLTSLLAAGLPIDRALESSSHYQRDKNAKELSTILAESLRAGLSITESFQNIPRQFDALYIQIIATGESTGNLPEAFSQISGYREKADRARARVRRAAAYPALVLLVAIAAITFLLVSVVPTYQNLYAEFNATLPASTQTLIEMATWLRENIISCVALTLFMVGLCIAGIRSGKGDRLKSQFILGAPIISLIAKPAAWGMVSRGLGTMLTSGVLLQDALEKSKQLSGNVVVHSVLETVQDRVAGGDSLSAALSEGRYVEPIVIQMAGVGEESGRLGESLVKAAEFLESEVDHRTETMLTLAEPVLILLVGGVVGLILLALYLPMFDLVSQTG